LPLHEEHLHGILTKIEDGRDVSQRSLSSHLGIALGLTNLLVRKVVRKGWVRAIRIKPNRVRYMLTPEGLAEKARMSSHFLQNSVRFYVAARDRIRQRLAEVPVGNTARVVFFGDGEVAEIAYVCLQETDLELVGVVGCGRDKFFGLPVQSVADLHPQALGTAPFDQLIVASFDNRDGIRAQLESCGVPGDRVFWL
jgi:DNA-binding MarR family transcriptional regulator